MPINSTDIITYALLELGVIAPGQVISDDEKTFCLYKLNAMLGSWSAEDLAVFAATMQTFPLSASKGSYTYGTGGEFNAPRPTKILGKPGILATIQGGAQIRVGECRIVTTEEWAEVKEKALSATTPLICYNDNAYPLATIYLWPKPLCPSATSIELYVLQPFASFALTDTFDMPPGYLRAVTQNLAVDLAPPFKVAIDPTLAALAQQSKNEIATLNASDKLAVRAPIMPAQAPPSAPQQAA